MVHITVFSLLTQVRMMPEDEQPEVRHVVSVVKKPSVCVSNPNCGNHHNPSLVKFVCTKLKGRNCDFPSLNFEFYQRYKFMFQS